MKRLLEQDADYYKVEVDFDLSIEGQNLDVISAPKTILLYYKMYFEYRSWGIKAIELVFDRPISINYEVENLDTDERMEKELTIDLSDAAIEWLEGGPFVPIGINLRLNSNGNVIDKTIDMYYLKP